MKIILSTFFIFLSSTIYCQTNIYHPFPESGAIWRMEWGEQSCFLNGLPQAEYRYIMNGDTLINSAIYHQIYREVALPYFCGPFYPNGAGYMGGIRQDTIIKKIWYLPFDSTSEKLLYDFSLTVGDTLPKFICDLYGYQNTTISSIDSILIGTNYQKKFNYSGGQIVEGLGNLAGLFEMSHIDLTPQLLCFIQDSIELYKLNTFINCDLVTNIVSNKNEMFSIELFPNPFHSYANLKSNNYYSNSILVIYNQMGTVVKKIPIYSKDQVIERNNLNNGVYFFQLIYPDGKFLHGKFLLN